MSAAFKLMDTATYAVYVALARHEEPGTRCPNCGSTAEMNACRLIGFDSGTGEQIDEDWLECVDCGARTTNEEVAQT